jgi:hypothetical protein
MHVVAIGLARQCNLTVQRTPFANAQKTQPHVGIALRERRMHEAYVWLAIQCLPYPWLPTSILAHTMNHVLNKVIVVEKNIKNFTPS